MAEIKKDNCVFTDTMDKIHVTPSGVACCGMKLKMIMHIDGTDFYEYGYQCECGNAISVQGTRKGE